MNDDGMPRDPFRTGSPDLTQWAANCRAMYTALVAAEFKESEAFEFTVRMMAAMMART